MVKVSHIIFVRFVSLKNRTDFGLKQMECCKLVEIWILKTSQESCCNKSISNNYSKTEKMRFWRF